jgi:hypothetical protein
MTISFPPCCQSPNIVNRVVARPSMYTEALALAQRFGDGPTKASAVNEPEQVRLVRQVVEGLGLDIASPDEARDMLKLKGGDKIEV